MPLITGNFFEIDILPEIWVVIFDAISLTVLSLEGGYINVLISLCVSVN